jgi:hypothetical protein
MIMAKIHIELNENDVKRLVVDYITNLARSNGVPDPDISEENVRIEVRSKQNYKSEWEQAEYRAIIDKVTK